MPNRRFFQLWISLIVVVGTTAIFDLEGAAQKHPRRKPTPTATPVPFQRAAGSCLRYEENQYVIVAELGQAGRVFRIDGETVIRVPKLKTGSRVRILFEDSPDGPVARRILPGPGPPPK